MCSVRSKPIKSTYPHAVGIACSSNVGLHVVMYGRRLTGSATAENCFVLIKHKITMFTPPDKLIFVNVLVTGIALRHDIALTQWRI